MSENKKKLSHLDESGKPGMVDVSAKPVTVREAKARSLVRFPADVFMMLTKNQFLGPKGSIFHTAVLAGTMAAKKTSELIPLCHPLALTSIKIEITPAENELQVIARVRCEGKTGVEMEALTAAGIAALTIYDMCKALSHDIVIAETMLLSKKGGKNDFSR